MPAQMVDVTRTKLEEVRKTIVERQADYEGYKEEMRKLRDQIHTLREQEYALERVIQKFPLDERASVPVALPVTEGEEEESWDDGQPLKERI